MRREASRIACLPAPLPAREARPERPDAATARCPTATEDRPPPRSGQRIPVHSHHLEDVLCEARRPRHLSQSPFFAAHPPETTGRSRDPAQPPRLELTPDMVEEPIRAELFGVERLEQHAESLAAAQPVLKGTVRGRPLLPRAQDTGRAPRETYRAGAKAIREERSIVPAAEWLVDNFHIVDEQLREIRDDLPPGFYRELPQLAAGPLQGYPRVFGLPWAFVPHTDSRFDPETLRRFVCAYQRVQPLTIGELWAVAIALRVVLVENLRRLAERIVRGRVACQEADALVDGLLGLG